MAKTIFNGNWQCRLPRCSQVGRFIVDKETDKIYYTRCSKCKLVNVFDKPGASQGSE